MVCVGRSVFWVSSCAGVWPVTYYIGFVCVCVCVCVSVSVCQLDTRAHKHTDTHTHTHTIPELTGSFLSAADGTLHSSRSLLSRLEIRLYIFVRSVGCVCVFLCVSVYTHVCVSEGL